MLSYNCKHKKKCNQIFCKFQEKVKFILIYLPVTLNAISFLQQHFWSNVIWCADCGIGLQFKQSEERISEIRPLYDRNSRMDKLMMMRR